MGSAKMYEKTIERFYAGEGKISIIGSKGTGGQKRRRELSSAIKLRHAKKRTQEVKEEIAQRLAQERKEQALRLQQVILSDAQAIFTISFDKMLIDPRDGNLGNLVQKHLILFRKNLKKLSQLDPDLFGQVVAQVRTKYNCNGSGKEA